MNDIARSSGRTIIFVSHNIAAIESLCDTCLLLDSGQLIMKSTPQEALSRYVAAQAISSTGTRSLAVHPGRRSNYKPYMRWVELYSGNTPCNGVIRMGASFSIIVSYVHERPVQPLLGAVIKTLYGAPVFCVSDRYSEHVTDSAPRSCGRVICTIDDLRLMPGTYMIDLYLGEAAEDFDAIIDAISFEVVAADLNGTGRLAPSSLGPMYCSAKFQLVPEARDLINPAGSPPMASATTRDLTESF